MKLSHLLLFPLGICALKLPHYRISDDDGTQDLQTRITAFLVDEKGNPKVECWEVSSSTETMNVKRKDGSVAAAHRSQLVKGDDINVNILSWPAYSPIWPPASNSEQYKVAQLFSGQNFFSLFKGLIVIERISLFNVTSQVTDDDGQYYFGPDNGDDWFYFEDNCCTYDDAMRAAEPEHPFSINAVSGGNTQLLSIQHSVRPTYQKVHDGACGYTGVRVPSSGKSTGKHIELNVQFEEL